MAGRPRLGMLAGDRRFSGKVCGTEVEDDALEAGGGEGEDTDKAGGSGCIGRMSDRDSVGEIYERIDGFGIPGGEQNPAGETVGT